jgi:hypothetical protein
VPGSVGHQGRMRGQEWARGTLAGLVPGPPACDPCQAVALASRGTLAERPFALVAFVGGAALPCLSPSPRPAQRRPGRPGKKAFLLLGLEVPGPAGREGGCGQPPCAILALPRYGLARDAEPPAPPSAGLPPAGPRLRVRLRVASSHVGQRSREETADSLAFSSLLVTNAVPSRLSGHSGLVYFTLIYTWSVQSVRCQCLVTGPGHRGKGSSASSGLPAPGTAGFS